MHPSEPTSKLMSMLAANPGERGVVAPEQLNADKEQQQQEEEQGEDEQQRQQRPARQSHQRAARQSVDSLREVGAEFTFFMLHLMSSKWPG